MFENVSKHSPHEFPKVGRDKFPTFCSGNQCHLGMPRLNTFRNLLEVIWRQNKTHGIPSGPIGDSKKLQNTYSDRTLDLNECFGRVLVLGWGYLAIKGVQRCPEDSSTVAPAASFIAKSLHSVQRSIGWKYELFADTPVTGLLLGSAQKLYNMFKILCIRSAFSFIIRLVLSRQILATWSCTLHPCQWVKWLGFHLTLMVKVRPWLTLELHPRMVANKCLDFQMKLHDDRSAYFSNCNCEC